VQKKEIIFKIVMLIVILIMNLFLYITIKDENRLIRNICESKRFLSTLLSNKKELRIKKGLSG